MIQIDIQMPKGCALCPYLELGWNRARCKAKSKTGREIKNPRNMRETRQKWCPLKDVGGESE